MNRRFLVALPLALVFVAKYVELYAISLGNLGEIFGSKIMLISAAISGIALGAIAILSYKKLEGKWRNGNIALSLFSEIFVLLYLFIPNAPLYLTYNSLMVTSLFTFLYPFHHYEIKKYPAFGYAFLLTYVVLEGASLWRESVDLIVFLLYLTLSLSMFLPGIIKIRE